MESTLRQDFRGFVMERVEKVGPGGRNEKIKAAEKEAERAMEDFLRSVELSGENKKKLNEYLDAELAARAEEVVWGWMRGWQDAMELLLRRS